MGGERRTGGCEVLKKPENELPSFCPCYGELEILPPVHTRDWGGNLFSSRLYSTTYVRTEVLCHTNYVMRHGQRLPCKCLICYLCNLLCRYGFCNRANSEKTKQILDVETDEAINKKEMLTSKVSFRMGNIIQ